MEVGNIIKTSKRSNNTYIRQLPYVNDDGIYVPVNDCVPEGCASIYKCVMTREMFVEAYNKWIKNKSYYYCVNTFKNGEPVQLDGHIDAESEEDAIQKLIENGTVNSRGYEFLELEVV